MKKLILLLLLIPAIASAGGRWTVREPLRDGPGINNLLKDSDHGGIVWLADPTLPDAYRVHIFYRKLPEGETKCRWKRGKGYGKLRRFTGMKESGRANGNREHWRSFMCVEADEDGRCLRIIKVEDLPPCSYVRMVYDLGTDGRAKHAFTMNRVKAVRND